MNIIARMLIVAIVFGSIFSQASVSAEQFRQETNEHRARVCHGMHLAYAEFPKEFSHLDLKSIQIWCWHHDLPKVMSLQELKQYAYLGPEDIATVLGRFHGVRFANLSDEERSYAKATVGQLNKLEGLIKMDAITRLRAYVGEDKFRSTLVQLTQLEHWVDILDVGINREDIPTENTRGEAIRFLEKGDDLSDLGRSVLIYLEDTFLELKYKDCNRHFLPQH